jgi:hypothetical protein
LVFPFWSNLFFILPCSFFAPTFIRHHIVAGLLTQRYVIDVLSHLYPSLILFNLFLICKVCLH